MSIKDLNVLFESRILYEVLNTSEHYFRGKRSNGRQLIIKINEILKMVKCPGLRQMFGSSYLPTLIKIAAEYPVVCLRIT